MKKILFDFSDSSNGIKRCFGYVLAEREQEGKETVFIPSDVVVLKLIAKKPDWKKVGRLAIENAI